MSFTPYKIPIWKSAPFIRILLPLIAGIAAKWYLNIPVAYAIGAALFGLLLLTTFSFLSIAYRYKYKAVPGVLLFVLIFCTGIILTYSADVKNTQKWFGNYYSDSMQLVLKINEPPIEKDRSFKADGIAESIIAGGIKQQVKGKVLIYFAKADSLQLPKYGDKILLQGGLQRIKNSGNPGAFDYARYAGFQGIYHQVFLTKDKYVLLNEKDINPLSAFIFSARQRVVNIIQCYVKGDKRVTGIAEALLIGYKQDLDIDVVQEYSNTGVVHIIAISGMHLGLIYVVLVWVFSVLPVIKRVAVLRVILILSVLWIFSLITGGSASVLRSAVMFTCIIIGKTFFKQATIYNSLAASAFLLLCFDPFLLWDVGFQLSYFAVAGIVWLQRAIFSSLYIRNKYLRQLWEMCAVTIAAQIITFPICIYYFHQFPSYFLLSNIICVPLSTGILFAEIFLVMFAWFPYAAAVLGKAVYVLTWLMNYIISFINKVPGSLVDKIYATPLSTWLLYTFVVCACSWLLYKKKTALQTALGSLLLYAGLLSYAKFNLMHQRKMIVYNISRHSAIDFIDGDKYWFYGDPDFEADGKLQNFHLKPARIFFQADKSGDTLKSIVNRNVFWQFHNKKIMIADTAVSFEPLQDKIKTDVLVISHNPKLKIADITSAVTPAVIVFDASNSLWKIEQWKKECSLLNLRFHVAGEQGAFILNAD